RALNLKSSKREIPRRRPGDKRRRRKGLGGKQSGRERSPKALERSERLRRESGSSFSIRRPALSSRSQKMRGLKEVRPKAGPRGENGADGGPSLPWRNRGPRPHSPRRRTKRQKCF